MTGTQKLLAALITALALVALGVSSYLSWVTWQQSTVAGCTGASEAGCDEVLASSGSKWLGIPVSVLGALTYATILAVVWPAALRGGWLMTTLLTLAMMAAGAGVWFITSQAFIVKHFCVYCMTVHVCGLLICTLSVMLLRSIPAMESYDPMQSFFAPNEETPLEVAPGTPLQPLIAAGIASVGLGALIGGQMFFAPSGMEVVDIPVPAIDDARTAADATSAESAGPSRVGVDEQSGESQSEEVFDEDKAQSDTPPLVVEENITPSRVDQANDIAERAEPAGDAVVATDESENGRQDPAADVSADSGDVETETSNQSFEELFGESPGEMALTPTSATEVPRVFRFKYLKGDIDVENNPVLGNPYARVRLVEMLDYTCPHCRKLHPFVEKALERYGDQIGVVVYHVPLSRKCNQLVHLDQVSHTNACDLARLAFGVWKLTPAEFPEFHNWLMKGKKAPPLYDAKSRAMELAGSTVLTDKSIDVESKRRVADHAADMEALQVGLPILIFESGVIKGIPNSEADWYQMLEQRLGLKPAAATAQN